MGVGIGATAAAITACSGNSGQTPDSTNGGKPTGSIRFSMWPGGATIPAWKDVIARFQRSHPGAKVTLESTDYGTYWTKLNTQMASGSAPDVIGMQFQGPLLGLQGQLAPLDSTVADVISKIPANLASIGQTKDKDGKTATYALPWHFVGSSLYANMTELGKAGIAYPDSGWTTDDFLAAAKELTGDGSFGCQVPQGSMQTAIASTFGAAPLSADGKTATYNTSEMLANKTWLRDLIYVHKVAPQPSKLSAQKDPFATGQVRMSFQGSWQTPVYREIKNFKWDILPNPNGQQQAKNYAGPDMVSVYAKSKNMPLAQAFIKYAVFNRDAQEAISPTGSPVLIDYLSDPARIAAEAKQKPAHYKYFVDEASKHGEGWAFVPKFSDIGKLESDAEYKIYASPTSDIQGILADLNDKVQAALDSTH